MKKLLQNLISYTAILLFGVYTLNLYFNDKLLFYIHPRYTWFSVTASVICILVAIFGYFYEIYKNWSFMKSKNITKLLSQIFYIVILPLFGIAIFLVVPLSIILLLIILRITYSKVNLKEFMLSNRYSHFLFGAAIIAALILPAKPLSYKTASQRSVDLNSLTAQEDSNVLKNFTYDTSKYTIGEWVKSMNVNEDLQKYKNKKVNVVGFLYHPESYPEDEFLVSRFVVTCCAVDARPIGLVVKYDWKDKYKQNDWVEVSGTFDAIESEDEISLIVVPTEVKSVPEPKQPYIY